MLAPTQSQLVPAGSSQISTITNAPPKFADKLTWRLINDLDGTVVIAESSDAITEIDDGHDPVLRRYDRHYVAPAVAGRYLAVWRLEFDQEVAQTIVVGTPTAAFAAASDVAKRLGRPLTTRETANVPGLLQSATTVIADAAGYDEGWASQLAPIPNMLSLLCVELVCRVLPNPSQWSTIRQQVGSYGFQASQTLTGMQLSDAEVMMVRRAVHGRTTDSVTVESGFVQAQDEYWLRKQAMRATGVTESGGTIA
jgi:hypothetical protein